jgi:hypothetical protein
MRHIADLQQEQLFDPFEHLLSRQARQSLQEGWQGVFRHAILELLPVDAVAEKFHPTIGRPTKELYSVAGLILILEFRNWTKEEAVEAYMFHSDVWYVLNMGPGQHGMSVRTLERYQRIFREEELAQSIMDDVTSRLVELLELDISKQRLDSTHVFSDMAAFGRTRMMGIAIKRFLTQVKRHDRAAYDALPEEIRARYRPSAHQLFGDTMKDKEKRALLLQQVAEDLHRLLEGFADNARVNNGQTFKLLRTIFEQQCEVVSPAIKVHAADSDTKVEETVVEETKVVIKTKTGGNVIQNPSDPDATYDAHKGAGYQVQLTQTCGENNEVQLITSALPQKSWMNSSGAAYCPTNSWRTRPTAAMKTCRPVRPGAWSWSRPFPARAPAKRPWALGNSTWTPGAKPCRAVRRAMRPKAPCTTPRPKQPAPSSTRPPAPRAP